MCDDIFQNSSAFDVSYEYMSFVNLQTEILSSKKENCY